MKYEYRQDKYGQVVRVVCKCGRKSNWQRDKRTATHTLEQEHIYNDGCMTNWKRVMKNELKCSTTI